MDLMKSAPSADLQEQVNRRALGRMDEAYQAGAQHELKRRKGLTRSELHAHLVDAAFVHLNEWKATGGDVTHVRWARELLDEAVAIGLKGRIR